MSFPFSSSRMLQASIVAACLTLAAGTANAQSAKVSDSASASTPSADESSSSATSADATEGADGLAALPSAPGASGAQEGGYGRRSGYNRSSLWNHMTFEAGGGFNAPESNHVTYGGNFTVGGGFKFNQYLAALVEFQYIDDKLPGALIAATQGADGGNAHIWSFTVDPVVDLFPKSTNDIYVTGGGGFYRKVTTFTVLSPTEFCTYFYCGIGYVPATVGHFSSNQGGWNIGAGYQRRLGGMYGDGKMRLFAEARYLEVLSPAIVGQSANGLAPVTIDADTKVIPVTLGIRF